MSDRFFLDTNIFAYGLDQDDRRKQSRANELVETALRTGRGVISFQVIQEFLNVAIHRFPTPLSHARCLRHLKEALLPLCQVYPSETLYTEALAVQALTGYHFHDSLIVAAALGADCSVLYTEDLQDGRQIRGLTIRNPFNDGTAPVS